MQSMSELLATEKQAIRRDAESKRKELRTLETVAKVWPPDVQVSSLHAYNLYGSVARATIGQAFPRYGAIDDRCTMEDVSRLLDKLPPLPLWKKKDGCTNFRPDTAMSDEQTMAEDTEQVWGVLLDVAPGYNAGGEEQSVEWYTKCGDLVVRVKCILSPASYPVSVSVDGPRQFGKGKLLRVTETKISPKDNFYLDQRVRWATGSDQYANRFTCYWIAVDDSQGVGKAWKEICGIEEAAE